MAYKRYIRKNGKLYGPYVYRSIRDKDGRVRNLYVGRGQSASKRRWFTLHPFQKNLLLILAAVVIAGGAFTFLLQPTGFLVAGGMEFRTIDLGLNVTGAQEIPLSVQETPESISVSGTVTGNGTVRIVALQGGKRYVIYSNTPSSEASPITGMAVGDEQQTETPAETGETAVEAPEDSGEIQQEADSAAPAEETGITEIAPEEVPVDLTVQDQAPPEEEAVPDESIPGGTPDEGSEAPAEEVVQEFQENQTADSGDINATETTQEQPQENETVEEAANETLPEADNVTVDTGEEIPSNITPPVTGEDNVTTEEPANVTNETLPLPSEAPPPEGNQTSNETLPPETTETPPAEEPGVSDFIDACSETCTLTDFTGASFKSRLPSPQTDISPSNGTFVKNLR